MFRAGFVGRQFPSGLGAGSISGTAPSLNLDFTKGVIDSRITLSRGSTATYFDSNGVLQTVSGNTMRMDYDPASKQVNGLLVEETRTNLCTQSGNLSTTAVQSSTLNQNVTTSPDGTVNASQIVESAVAATDHATDFVFTPAGNTTYVGSVFVKANTRNKVVVSFRSAASWVGGNAIAVADLVAGTITNVGGAVAMGIQPIGNGWFRIWCAATSVASPAAAPLRVGMADASGNVAYNGDGVSSAYFYGIQVEAAGGPNAINPPTSYIPTGAGTVTRNGEFYDMTPVTPWWNTPAHSYMIDFFTNNYCTSGGGYLRFDDGTTNNQDAISGTSSAPENYSVIVQAGGAPQINGNLASNIALSVPHKIAAAISAARSNSAVDGVINATPQGAITMPTGVNRMRIGNYGTGVARVLNGWVRQVKYWPRVLSDGELVQVTSDPTIDIGFVDPAGGLDSRITLTRTGVATYIDANKQMQLASVNTARFDHDVATGNALGLLVEEARSNIMTSSDTILSASFSTIDPGTTTPLKAGANVYKVLWPNINANGPLTINIPVSSSTTYTASMFVWLPAAYDPTQDGPPQIDFDMASLGAGGTVVLKQQADISKRNQWQRITTVVTLGTGASATMNFVTRRLAPWNGGQIVYCTCPQVEAGAFATSYIPSTGSPPTARGADVVTMPNSPTVVTQLGTQAIEAMINQLNNSPRTLIGVLQVGVAKTSINLSGGNGIAIFDSGGLNTVMLTPNPVGQIFKAGFAYQNGTQRGAVNGANNVSTSQATLSTPTPTLCIGCDGSVQQINGYIRRIRYWPRVLGVAELNQVTT